MIISSIYAIAAVLSLLLLAAYFVMIKKKEAWFFVLFTAIFVVNAGYFALSISDTLDAALWANRLSYAGLFIIFLKMLQVEMLKVQDDKIKFQKLAHQHQLENGTLELGAEKRELFARGLTSLTHTERRIYDLYLEGSTTKGILAALDIKENTLKYHNKNIYGKLGVSSRKELVAVAKAVKLRK